MKIKRWSLEEYEEKYKQIMTFEEYKKASSSDAWEIPIPEFVWNLFLIEVKENPNVEIADNLKSIMFLIGGCYIAVEEADWLLDIDFRNEVVEVISDMKFDAVDSLGVRFVLKNKESRLIYFYLEGSQNGLL